MLSEDAINNLVQPIIDRQESINMYVINKIASRLRDVGELRPSDINKMKILVDMGADINEINKEMARISDKQIVDIKRIIRTVAIDSYKDVKPFYDYRNKSYIPFQKNVKLQNIVNAVGNRTAKTYVNISNSKATGFLISDTKNPKQLRFKTIDKTYRQVIDKAIQAAQSGAVDTRTAINNAVKELLNSGVRRLSWDSGYTQRLDTAVRRNVLEGIRAVNQEIQDEVGKQFDADGKELSAHPNSAPDHEPFQGHIFTNAEWDKLQSSQDFTDIDGEHFTGVDRVIGMWNCYHIAYSIVIGAKKRRYTKEQLQKFIKDNNKGRVLSDGKHLSMYECTQMQRKLETRIRYAKEEQIAMRTLKDKEAIRQAKAKVVQLTNEYKIFSRNCGLPVKKDRISIPNY